MAVTAPRNLFLLAALLLLALLPRLSSVHALGWGWDGPDSFTLVNFDEGGSCRAALGGFDYSGFVGRQTITLSSLLGNAPPAGIVGDASAVKTWCQHPQHLLVARYYSAVTGALTAVLIAVMALLLLPQRPAVAWTAGGLVALSGFHIAESHSATVDAPSTFFIYLFLTAMVYGTVRASAATLRMSPLLLIAAVWTKYWVFAVLAYLAMLPQRLWQYLSDGLGKARLCLLMLGVALMAGLLSNLEFRQAQLYPLLALWYLLVPWRRIRRGMIPLWLIVPPLLVLVSHIDLVSAYTAGGAQGRFGTSYGAIGWHKLPRNLLNLPLVLLVGLGLPALLFLPAGVKALWVVSDHRRAWCCLLPLAVFALYMAFVSPITYYRHYLPLLPAAALLAALGLHSTRWGGRCAVVALVLAWQGALAVDLVVDYHDDPRRALRAWYAQDPQAPVFVSYYVNPPASRSRLFRPEYADGDGEVLRQARFLVLSENWYDTAFANELNGPLVQSPQRLVKTRPEYTAFYRAVVAGEHPLLQPEVTFPVHNFMPELLLHSRFYGTFQLFVGDIRIFRVRG